MKRLLIILLFGIAGLAAGLAIDLFRPHEYESHAVVRIGMENPFSATFHAMATLDTSDRLPSASFSRRELSPLIESLGLFPDERSRLPNEDILEMLRKHIQVRELPPDLMEIRFHYPDPQKAQAVLARLLDLVRANAIERLLERQDKISRIAQQALQDAEKGVAAAEARARPFPIERPVSLQAELELSQRHMRDMLSDVAEAVAGRHALVMSAGQTMQVVDPPMTPDIRPSLYASAAVGTVAGALAAVSLQTVRKRVRS